MCVIAAKPKNIVIPEETLRQCFERNPDGAGFVAHHDGRLILHKGFFTFESFWEIYQPFALDAAVIHFRIKTHGNKDADMCHPFVVNDNLVVAHNGIINISNATDTTKSDTWMFVEYVLKPEMAKSPAAYKRPSFQFLLSGTIDNSKLAFLDSKGAITLINEEKGVKDGEVWYSNSSFRKTMVTTTQWSSTYTRGSQQTTTPTETTRKTKQEFYTSLDDVPASDAWVVDTLREFHFKESEILAEMNEGTGEDIALDLILFEAASVASGDTVTREAVAAELASSGSELALVLQE